MEKRKLPKKDRPKGLFLYCNNCDRYYKNDLLIKCKCDNLVYRAKIHVPGTGYRIKAKVLYADNLTDAFVLFQEYKNELKRNSYQKIPINKTIHVPTLLIECFAYYMGFLNNVDVPKHKYKVRSSGHLQHFDLAFRLYKEALEENDIDCNILKFTDVNDEMVGFIHEYLLKHQAYSNKTYNNHMAMYSQFTTKIITQFNLSYANPFLGVEKLLVNTPNLVVDKDEFMELLELVKPENSIKIVKRRGRTTKQNMYRDWLKCGFLLGLFTGGRSDELTSLKWSGISLHKDGSFNLIKTVHFKANRSVSHLVSKKDFISKEFAITKELGALLIALGFDTFKDTDQYLFAPERSNREQVGTELSRAFCHYCTLLENKREIKFKNLRKTFITSAVNKYGLSALSLTSHLDPKVVIKHYVGKRATQIDAQKNFQIFPEEEKTNMIKDDSNTPQNEKRDEKTS